MIIAGSKLAGINLLAHLAPRQKIRKSGNMLLPHPRLHYPTATFPSTPTPASPNPPNTSSPVDHPDCP